MHPFEVGQQYTRKDVFRIVGIADPGGGSWFTGYTPHGDDHFIFCGIETAGRTGHNYHNHFVGDELVWFGNTRSRLNQPAMQRLLRPRGSIYIFYRENDRSPFTFAGIAEAKSAKDTRPVEVVWSFASSAHLRPEILPNEISPTITVFEGAKQTVTVNIYERDPNARRKCIDHWGSVCTVCSFDFGKKYGPIGVGYIHVHHLKPLSEIGETYELNPVADLRPVCPNCHAMLHRTAPAMSIEQLKAVVARKPVP